jgi:hypothetical protein
MSHHRLWFARLADGRYNPACLVDRMGMRRMTRPTNAHSKKWENHEAAFALWFAYYSFSRLTRRGRSETTSARQPQRWKRA